MITIHRYAGATPEYFDIMIYGMRNSWESHEKSDSIYYPKVIDEYNAFNNEQSWFDLGENDKALFLRLIQTGPDHGKTLRQIPLIIDTSAPNYFWIELDTYKIGTTRNSTSKMHILGKHPFKVDMFSFEDMHIADAIHMVSFLNQLRERWIAAGKKKGPNQKEWRAMVQAIPDSWMYRSSLSLNYQVLRNMYHARKNHRLEEWRSFCDWIETLPYAELIIT